MYPLAVSIAFQGTHEIELIVYRDIKTGILHVRKKVYNVWQEHQHQWKVNMATSICSRFTPRGEERLVDPYCALSARISRIFLYFEHRRHLTVYQPEQHALTVDLP